MFNKEKNIVVFVKEIGNTYKKIGKQKFDVKATEILYKEYKFPIKILPQSIKIKNNYIWIIDIDKGFITLNKPNTTIDFELIKNFLLKNIYVNVMSNLMSSKIGKKLYDLILGIIIGVLIGLFIGVFFL